MGKSKSEKSVKSGISSKHEVKKNSPVKNVKVTKPSQAPKSKSQDIAKQVAVKADKKSKKVKEPTPESSSEESDGDSDDGDSSASSDDEAETSAPKANGKLNGKVNGHAKAVAHEDTSDSSDSSEDDEKPTAPKATPATGGKGALAVKDKSESEEDSEEDSDDDDSESDEEKVPAANGPVDANKLDGALKKVASEEDSEEDSDDSGSEESSESDADEDSADSDSSEDESEEEAAPKKRKAEEVTTPAAKKSKTEPASEGNGIKNLFVGSLSWSVDEEWLTREFEGFGELSGVRVISDRDSGRSKGFGYVEFVSAADAAKAHDAMKGATIDSRQINVDFAAPRDNNSTPGGYKEKANDRAKTYGDQPSEPSDTLFVGNISFEANEDIIGEEFGKYGTVQGVRLPTDPDSGNPKGFGYVQFGSIDEAKEAFENMKGAAICGRPIRLDYGRARDPNGGSPRGGGRGGGRGRGGFGDRGGRGGGRGRGGFGDRGGRGGGRGRGTTNRGGFGDFQGKKMTF